MYQDSKRVQGDTGLVDGVRRGYVFSEQSLQDILDCVDEDVFIHGRAEAYSGRGDAKEDVTELYRGTSQRVGIHYNMFPEAKRELEEWVGDGTKVGQFDLIIYRKGSRFLRHIDNYNGRDIDPDKLRIHSTSTILYKSDDLVGGDLILYDSKDDDVGTKVDIDVGETVLFYPDRWHEVTEITQGVRICLISWLKNPLWAGRSFP